MSRRIGSGVGGEVLSSKRPSPRPTKNWNARSRRSWRATVRSARPSWSTSRTSTCAGSPSVSAAIVRAGPKWQLPSPGRHSTPALASTRSSAPSPSRSTREPLLRPLIPSSAAVSNPPAAFCTKSVARLMKSTRPSPLQSPTTVSPSPPPRKLFVTSNDPASAGATRVGDVGLSEPHDGVSPVTPSARNTAHLRRIQSSLPRDQRTLARGRSPQQAPP